ncbi:hypothetical protein V6N13_093269 [Hibiscus sabdariffa]
MNSDSPDPRLPKKQRRRDEDPLDSEMECDALYNQRPLLSYKDIVAGVDQNITPAINPLFEPTGAAQVTLPLPIIHEFNLDSSSNVTNPTVANPVINVESNSADDVDPSIRGKSKMRGKSTLTMKKGSGALVGSKKGVVVAAKSLKSHLPTPVILMQGPRSFSRNDASSSSIKQNLSKSIVLDPVKHQAVKHLESANSPIPLPVLTGCGHCNFIRTARQYIRDHKPDIVGFIETRISGFSADKIIALQFPNSYRVKADGFFGGFGYAGDFNATLSPEERVGCAPSSTPDFEFISTVFDPGLHDLGYLDSPYTWYKAHRAVRLDRCLCNSHWLEAFPDTLVHYLLRMKSYHKLLGHHT